MLNFFSSKRQSRALLQAFVVLTLILLYLFYANDGYAYVRASVNEHTHDKKPGSGSHAVHSGGASKIHTAPSHAKPAHSTSTPTPTALSKSKLPSQPLNETLAEDVPKYIKAIIDPFDTEFDRLQCPSSIALIDRYAYLRSTPTSSSRAAVKPKYYFALDLYKIADLLPRLMNSIIESIKFLGPENCVLSIVEGRSDDGTYEILYELHKELEKLGIQYILETSDLDPKGGDRDRIDALAELRNIALADLIDHPKKYDPDTTIVFSNDVSMCMEDILELIHQKKLQKADMMCGVDWNIWEPLTFYDSWVGRGIDGDLFLKIIKEGDQMVDYDAGIFWSHEPSRERFDAWKPVQVFACWNGITVFTAKPFMEQKIKFRFVPNDDEKECYQAEPNLFAKDMWYHGYGRIGVVPTVNLAYSDGDAKNLRKQKGWMQQHLIPDDEAMIEWTSEPPAKVVCVPWLRGDQTWHAWNQGLPGYVDPPGGDTGKKNDDDPDEEEDEDDKKTENYEQDDEKDDEKDDEVEEGDEESDT